MKRSHITPVFKGGAPNDPSNYRPIAVVPVVAKILERIVATQLSVYLERNNLLHPHQGAYRCGKSTDDILLLAVDYIATLLDKGCVVCAAFIDLRRHFTHLTTVCYCKGSLILVFTVMFCSGSRII